MGRAQALTVTTLGGLAMLVGFLILGHHAGTYRWSELAQRPLPGGAYLVVAVLLILLGALSKSAVLPFTSWLPVAMAAPTPVSAYLHAAAMVKAGVYLLGLLTPVLAVVGPWRPVVLIAGLATMLVGGWAALRQTDLKLLLAYGTVSQLGLLTVVVGVGTADAALAGVAMLLAHALFKAALFLVVGVIDHGAGTRDLRELSGLRRTAPVLTGVAVLAAASMAGLPPLFGFVAKEAVFAAFADQPLVLAVLVVGTVLTVAYSIRFIWGAFADRPGADATDLGRIAPSLLAPPALLAVVGLVAGPERLDPSCSARIPNSSRRRETPGPVAPGSPRRSACPRWRWWVAPRCSRCAARWPRCWPGCDGRSPANRGTSGPPTASTGSR